MSNSDILNIIKDGLMDSIPNLNYDAIKLNSHLKNDLGIDSLSSMFFLTYLEDNIQGFEVNPDTIEARHFNTLQTIYDYVMGSLSLVTTEVE
ncbi:acyl carrier protein [Tenacibaculum sp. MAR_2009_124]|uniref:acyl carrier protein n=1 Tax=Tenacibaculum sp. MAR_2009_124 TaxID=1250059 RepID=UPI0008944FD8|nr:acyl carrier protein [Tenacibaculum sp. MAR_2009_124]SEB49579.1 acyl carrier protein [Tenacibaculum sp. MAR_2009_124]